jgi:c-di-GMP-binding flagellar brake protein YcgR
LEKDERPSGRESAMLNRRKRYRFIERNDVLIRTGLNKYQGTGVSGYTHDLSTGGARIYIKKEYPPGAVIRLRMDLERTSQSVTLDAKVIWVKADEAEGVFEIGVEFQNLTSHTILALIKHLYGDQVRVPSPAACRVLSQKSPL